MPAQRLLTPAICLQMLALEQSMNVANATNCMFKPMGILLTGQIFTAVSQCHKHQSLYDHD